MVEIIESLKSVYMELGLVFDKGDNNEAIKSQLNELVGNALQEARNFCPYITYKNNKLSGEDFDKLESIEKADIIRSLGEQIGLSRFDTMKSMEGKLEIEFSQHIQSVLSCTMFSILNRLENLDGAINVFNPKVELTIVAPLGGKKGLMKCEMLIMMLYPWIQIQEISSNVVATTPQERTAPSSTNHQTKEENKSIWDKIKKKLKK